jgi:hypothetical protein
MEMAEAIPVKLKMVIHAQAHLQNAMKFELIAIKLFLKSEIMVQLTEMAVPLIARLKMVGPEQELIQVSELKFEEMENILLLQILYVMTETHKTEMDVQMIAKQLNLDIYESMVIQLHLIHARNFEEIW